MFALKTCTLMGEYNIKIYLTVVACDGDGKLIELAYDRIQLQVFLVCICVCVVIYLLHLCSIISNFLN